MREGVLAGVQPKVHLSVTAYLKAKHSFELIFVECMLGASMEMNLPYPFGTTALSAAKYQEEDFTLKLAKNVHASQHVLLWY